MFLKIKTLLRKEKIVHLFKFGEAVLALNRVKFAFAFVAFAFTVRSTDSSAQSHFPNNDSLQKWVHILIEAFSACKASSSVRRTTVGTVSKQSGALMVMFPANITIAPTTKPLSLRSKNQQQMVAMERQRRDYI